MNTIVSIISGIIGVFFITINYIIFWKGYVKKEETPSVTPFLGGVFAAISILLITDGKYRFLSLLPLLLDLGCIPAIFRLMYACFYRKDLFK